MGEHVEVPVDKNVFPECSGLVFDTDVTLEDELEVGRRTSLNKYHNYIYATVTGMIRNDGRPYIPFK